MISASFTWFSFGLVGQVGQQGVEALVALLGLPAVPLDPRGHEVEHLRFEVDGATLGLPAAADQAGVLQHPQVLGDGLDRHVVGLGQLVDRGVGQGQPGDHVPPGGVGQRREHLRELIGRRHVASCCIQPLG